MWLEKSITAQERTRFTWLNTNAQLVQVFLNAFWCFCLTLLLMSCTVSYVYGQNNNIIRYKSMWTCDPNSFKKKKKRYRSMHIKIQDISSRLQATLTLWYRSRTKHYKMNSSTPPPNCWTSSTEPLHCPNQLSNIHSSISSYHSYSLELNR